MPPALEAPEEPHGATCGDGQLLRSGKGRHEDQRRALEWADLCPRRAEAAKAKPWSLRAKTSGNSHCTPTGTAATLAEIVKRAHEPPIIGVCCSSKSRRPRTEGPTQ